MIWCVWRPFSASVLAAAGLDQTRQLGISDEEYFQNLETIWLKLGRQPLYREIEKPISRFCAGSYEYRFGSWREALEAFVAYMNGEEMEQVPAEDATKQDQPPPTPIHTETSSEPPKVIHKTMRKVSDRLRFRVFYRDGMTCKICGKSKAKYPDLEIVVDHIFPWSKGGETFFENLQTLCRPCNGGKGDLGQSEGLGE